MTEKVSADAGEKSTLYAMPFQHENLRGLNCYLPDASVPGTSAYLEAQKEADTLLAELGREAA